jgi:hypothetical protein
MVFTLALMMTLVAVGGADAAVEPSENSRLQQQKQDGANDNDDLFLQNPATTSTASPSLLSSRLQHMLWNWNSASSVSTTRSRAARLQPYAAASSAVAVSTPVQSQVP